MRGVGPPARGALGLALVALPLAAALAPGAARGEEAKASLRPVVGEIETALVEPGETLLDIAYARRLGFESLRRLNPEVDVWIPPPGTVVRLPTRAVLPHAPEEGLVLNVPEMRLYDFTGGGGAPRIYSVAVGDLEDPTPIGRFSIGEKRTNPVWNVPRSIREERPELPRQVAPGPANPLGSRWMTIGRSSYGIHGTNIRWSIGREATHGCVRLYEDEMKALYQRVPTGTPLHVVYQRAKWGREGRMLYLEVHPDLYGRAEDGLAAALAVPRALGLLGAVDVERAWRALDEARGVPEPVGTIPEDWTPRR